ncbi:MAG TPA: hypothetical protein VIH88_15305 [Candidatus Acidoferrales bacterium]
MAHSRLLLTAVPCGITKNQGLLTVLVSPQFNMVAEMNAMKSWTASLKAGKISFNLDTPQGLVPLNLDKGALQPALWAKIFGDATFLPFGQSVKISDYKVNLSSTRDTARKLHQSFINRTDGSVAELKKLHSDAAARHGYYAVSPNVSAAAAGSTNKPADVVVTRITGRSEYSPSDVTPAAYQAMVDIGKIGQKQTHILHHVHRLCAAPRARRSDTLDPQFLRTGAAKPTPPAMDFHKRLSVLLNMTPVMDALGLILSFWIPESQFGSLQAVRVVGPTMYQDPATHVSIPFASPFTNLDSSRFLPSKRSTALTDAGWIDPADGYQIDSLQLDSAAMHVYQFSTASALRQKNVNQNPNADPNSDVVSEHNEDHSTPILPPSPHTGGLTVWQDDRQTKIQAKVLTTTRTTLDNTSRLNAEDILSGIVVDVQIGADDENWLHLTRRNERYEFQGSVVTAQDREHGVRTAASRRSDTTESGTNDFDVDETIFTWKLGSLAIKADTNGVAPLRSQGKDHLNSHSVPWMSGTKKLMTLSSPIPSPLFGETYGVAMRPVYVTGRTAPFDSKTATRSSLPPTKFLRYEVVQGPAVIPVKFTAHHTDQEHRTLMIVGSKLDENRKPHVLIPSSLRALAPMSVIPEVARRHGKTDDELAQGSTVFQLTKGSLPLEVKLRDGDSTGVYLPDPLCTGVIASLYDIDGKPIPGVTKQCLNYYDASGGNDDDSANLWPNYIVHFIELQPDDASGKPSLTVDDFHGVSSVFPFPIDKSRKIVCKLPPGSTAVLRLTPQLSPDTDNVHALVGLLTRGHSAQDSDICRPTYLRISYATDIPIQPPNVLVSDINGIPASPSLDRTNKNVLQLAVTAESFSTSKVAVVAKWKDVIDDVTQDTWSSRDSNARLAEFALPKKPLPAGQWSGTQEIQLPFSDTRYRQLSITPCGTSRWADVFLKNPSSDVAPTLPGKVQIVECLATAAPPVPDVEYVVPTLRWDIQKSRHTRTMGLSVILNRPWYASGNGEQLAVIVRDGTSVKPVLNQLPAVYSANQEDTQSAWGMHPDWAGYADIPSNPDKNSITVGDANSTIAVVQSTGTKYIVPFTPQYNDQDQQWFCNVNLSAPPAYGAVVRLIVARYQSMAVDKCKLSPTVACDFALLGPQRCMVITRTGHFWNRKVRIQIYGVGAFYNQPRNVQKLMTTFQVFRVSLSLTNSEGFNWENRGEIQADREFAPNATLLWQGTVSSNFLDGSAVLVREFENYPGAEDPMITRPKEVYVDVFQL